MLSIDPTLESPTFPPPALSPTTMDPSSHTKIPSLTHSSPTMGDSLHGPAQSTEIHPPFPFVGLRANGGLGMQPNESIGTLSFGHSVYGTLEPTYA